MFARLRLRRISISIVFVALAMIMTVGTAFARYGPPPGSGGGSGHGGGETTAANNLSVPTIMVNGGFTGVTCPAGTPGALVVPTGDPLTGYPINPAAYYYVQGINTWQAQCYTAPAALATAAWGDNLTGEARKVVGHPIRVELGLMNSDTAAPSMQGYKVVKLEPNALDRESAYGTLATGSPTAGFSAIPQTFPYTETVIDPESGLPETVTNRVRVYDAGVTFSIKNVATGAYVIPLGTKATAEINAAGAVVYGYNLRVSVAGDYLITFNIPTVTINGANAGSFATHLVSLTITVTTGSGGGQGGPPNR